MEDTTAVARYSRGRVLGAGGMGTVYVCTDNVLRRKVAMKVLDAQHHHSSEAKARFLREVRIQGQLQHPGVVPVYEVLVEGGVAHAFTMKRVDGMTLAAVIDGLKAGRRYIQERFTTQSLLGMFRQLCLCVAYTHARSVIHRDLKPANVMVGAFGEVYLLDWGLCKVVTGPSSEQPADTAKTTEGQLLGTPGYIPPEQALGADQAGFASDVYALGAILFEILTLELLHEGETPVARLRSTQIGINEQTRERLDGAGVSNELASVCLRALESNPGKRYETARAFLTALDDVLNRDRDAEALQRQADHHAERAEEAAMRAITGSALALEARSLALREAGHALALDPASPGAKRALAVLMKERLEELPQAVAGAVQEEEEVIHQRLYRIATVAYPTIAVMVLGFSALAGVRSWSLVIVTSLLCALAGTVAAAPTRWVWLNQARRTLMLALVCLALALGSGFFGALIAVPALAVANTLANQRLGFVSMVLGALAIAVPFGLEWAGILPQAYAFEDGLFVVHAVAVEFPDVIIRLALLTTGLAAIAVSCIAIWVAGDALSDFRNKAHIHRWQLETLLPPGLRVAPKDPSRGSP